MKNLQMPMAFAASVLVAAGLAQGTIQEYIHFNDVLGEIAMFVMALTMAALTGFAIVSDIVKNVRK